MLTAPSVPRNTGFYFAITKYVRCSNKQNNKFTVDIDLAEIITVWLELPSAIYTVLQAKIIWAWRVFMFNIRSFQSGSGRLVQPEKRI